MSDSTDNVNNGSSNSSSNCHEIPIDSAIEFDRRIGWLDMIDTDKDTDIHENVDQALFESF